MGSQPSSRIQTWSGYILVHIHQHQCRETPSLCCRGKNPPGFALDPPWHGHIWYHLKVVENRWIQNPKNMPSNLNLKSINPGYVKVYLQKRLRHSLDQNPWIHQKATGSFWTARTSECSNWTPLQLGHSPKRGCSRVSGWKMQPIRQKQGKKSNSH